MIFGLIPKLWDMKQLGVYMWLCVGFGFDREQS